MGSASTGASHVVSQFTDTARSTRNDLVALGLQALKLINSYRAHDGHGVDAVLGRIGFRRRESVLRPLAFFAAGAAVGGATVLLLSPGGIKALREWIGELREAHTQADVATAAEPATAAAPPAKCAETANGVVGIDQAGAAQRPS